MSIVALFVIIFLVIAIAAVIVLLGSLPAKIAVKRNHPHVDAVNAASWIGLATGIFWPIAFIWAFCPFPTAADSSAPGDANEESVPSNDAASLQQQLASLEAQVADLQSARKAGA